MAHAKSPEFGNAPEAVKTPESKNLPEEAKQAMDAAPGNAANGRDFKDALADAMSYGENRNSMVESIKMLGGYQNLPQSEQAAIDAELKGMDDQQIAELTKMVRKEYAENNKTAMVGAVLMVAGIAIGAAIMKYKFNQAEKSKVAKQETEKILANFPGYDGTMLRGNAESVKAVESLTEAVKSKDAQRIKQATEHARQQLAKDGVIQPQN